jgi:hypothetical protein
LFIDAIKGKSPQVRYKVNGKDYKQGYYLADKIYPEWASFVKSISRPQSEKDKLYSARQESVRKDVECAFGVLQARFAIIHRPARLWHRVDVVNIMLTCVILHNMIVEDEKELAKIPIDLNENASASIALPPEVKTSSTPNQEFAALLQRNAQIRDRSAHVKLRDDLVEHIWHRFGKKKN